MSGYNLISIVGPTACGKTAIGVRVAAEFGGVILSADSRQVYRGLDIGSGKDYDSYNYSEKAIPYRLIDIADPAEEYNLFNFISDFGSAYSEALQASLLPVMVGGSGMYLSSIIQNYFPKKIIFRKERFVELNSLNESELSDILASKNLRLHNITDFENKGRMITAILISESPTNETEQDINYTSLNFLIDPGKEKTCRLIEERLEKRLQSGLVEEVEKLLLSGINNERMYKLGLEYRYISLYLNREMTFNEMKQKLASSIIKFAKRQRTWFRKMEREGVEFIKDEGTDAEFILNVIYEKKKAGKLSSVMPA